MKKKLRRAIKIDGELTADIDGKAMHVQLLYQKEGATIPSGDPYLYLGQDRKVAKRIMLLMMNTREEMIPEQGRKAVTRTYRNNFGEDERLPEMILNLESHHQAIANHFYKPNWGDLQRTEAAIVLDIMEAGMNDNIVILPVHDGCLCPRQYKSEVLEYFSERGIEATENVDHLKPLPIEETVTALGAVRRLNAA